MRVHMGRDHEAELYGILKQGSGPAESAPEEETVVVHEEKNLVDNAAPKPFSSKNMFVHHDTHPLVLDIKLMDQYGTDWFEWESSTLWSEIMDDFRTPSISDHTKSKIQAVRTVHISDWCFTKWETFCVVTQALNNNIPDFEVMRKPTISQLFVSVDIMTMIRNDVEFSQEVQQWCGASLIDMGVIAAVQPVAFCQDEILEIQKARGIPVDPEPVKEKYRQVMSIPAEEVILEETPIDIQVAQLIIARDYLKLRRDQMTHQLRVLR